MIVISPTELRSNMKKYLELAKKEKVIIQRGRNETFFLSTEEVYLTPDENMAKGITVEELLTGIEEDIRKHFRMKYNK